MRNPEAESFFRSLSAHDDVASAFTEALERLGEYRVQRAPGEYGALYAVTKDTVFGGVAGQASTYWRLRPGDVATALACGATQAIGPDWVELVLFRTNWPAPDLPFWALRAYDFARTGR